MTFDSQRVDISIDDADSGGGRTASRSDEIGEWLRQKLADGATPQKELADEACRKFNISSKWLGRIASDHGIGKWFSAAQNCWVWGINR